MSGEEVTERPLRTVSDARTLRALAHPVRIALIEALTLGGAMTATEVGDRIGETPTTCSFHLRQLARYGFVEEAGGGRGRARPWRMTSIGMSITTDHDDDPESDVAGTAVTRLLRERQFERHRQWLETRHTYPKPWRQAAEENEFVVYLTAAELTELNRELRTILLSRFAERLEDSAQRPADALPVEMLMLSFPVSAGAAR
jgi:DNA-binding transcriptional ArsR family regulator